MPTMCHIQLRFSFQRQFLLDFNSDRFDKQLEAHREAVRTW
jgi:hypothetical protein